MAWLYLLTLLQRLKYQLQDPGVVPSTSGLRRPKVSDGCTKPASRLRTGQATAPANLVSPSASSIPMRGARVASKAPLPTRIDPSQVIRKPGLGTMIRTRAAAVPPSQGELLASRRLRPASTGVGPTADTRPVASTARLRSSLPVPSPVSPALLEPLATGSAWSTQASAPGARNVSRSASPARQNSLVSNASSSCSSASSLARHRAFRARNRQSPLRRPAFLPDDDRVMLDMQQRAMSKTTTTEMCTVDSDESLETGSTVSESSIRTAATVNQPEIPFYAMSHPAKRWAADQDGAEGDSTDMCAPYMVPPAGPPMTLEWESDDPVSEADEVERVWRELESKLGRKVRGRSLRRGRWVVKPLPRGTDTDVYSPSEIIPDILDMYSEDHRAPAWALEPSPSEFSISNYMSPVQASYTVPSQAPCLPVAATALFDMSAPLVPSVSTTACTPWNTPAISTDTLRRSRRVKRKVSEGMVHDGRLSVRVEPGYNLVNEHSSGNPPLVAEDQASVGMAPPALLGRPRPVYRLDSHIISALSALKGAYESPDLDLALSSDPRGAEVLEEMDEYRSPDLDEVEDEINGRLGGGGLGLGVPLKLNSVYHLPTLSPSLRPASLARSRSVKQIQTEDKKEETSKRPWSFPFFGVSSAVPISAAFEEIEVGPAGTNEGLGAKLNEAQVLDQIRQSEDDEGEAAVLMIRDLDTGEMQEVRVDDL
ncbi:hypothetical protein IAU60_003758 [Kwoniella sp. DSM 27419]